MNGMMMGQVYCTKRHNSLQTKYILYIQGAHAPLHPRKTQRDKVLAAKQVGLYVPLNPPTFAQRGSWNVWVVNNYQRLSWPLNIWNVIHHATTSPCPQTATHQSSDIQVPN